MNREDALKLFHATANASAEDIKDAIDETLFTYKNEILQKYVVPRLLFKRDRQIQDCVQAESLLLTLSRGDSSIVEKWEQEPTDRIHFLEQYEAHISRLKLASMSSRTFFQLHQVVQALIKSQEHYMNLFKKFFSDFGKALPEEVNTRDMIDTGKLLGALKRGEPDNHQTWEIELELARIEKIQGL